MPSQYEKLQKMASKLGFTLTKRIPEHEKVMARLRKEFEPHFLIIERHQTFATVEDVYDYLVMVEVVRGLHTDTP